MKINTWLKDYIEDQKRVIDSIPVDQVVEIIEKFIEANKNKKQIFVFGNGGSASNASHFITDLGKSSSEAAENRFKCFSLNEFTSLITAIANDYAYEDVFVEQLKNFATPNDLVLTMSVSGSSPNLVKAIDWANKKELHTIALLGSKQGTLSNMADKVVRVDSTHYGRVEDLHMMICHMIAYAFIEIPELTK
jgi:D-sedoheptulose 7-phosphate isomerase